MVNWCCALFIYPAVTSPWVNYWPTIKIMSGWTTRESWVQSPDSKLWNPNRMTYSTSSPDLHLGNQWASFIPFNDSTQWPEFLDQQHTSLTSNHLIPLNRLLRHVHPWKGGKPRESKVSRFSSTRRCCLGFLCHSIRVRSLDSWTTEKDQRRSIMFDFNTEYSRNVVRHLCQIK